MQRMSEGCVTPLIDCPVATSQIFNEKLLAVANRLPSGEKATEQTSLICFPIVSDSSPVFTAHNFAASSSPPVTSVLPSGEKATAQIPSACPFNDPISCH